MFAAGAYVTDADWHDVYDRTRTIGTTRPVTLEQNVWVGDGAIICKGVTIGENSVIGAGAVVTSDVPANVIAAGKSGPRGEASGGGHWEIAHPGIDVRAPARTRRRNRSHRSIPATPEYNCWLATINDRAQVRRLGSLRQTSMRESA
ncbi:MAG: DapH/DapD/GlmU-related protein [Gammaproteobacteria bacterium]|nr:DapH/DapD/GlmU-related protein [Gammaproteobacteria bacterium]